MPFTSTEIIAGLAAIAGGVGIAARKIGLIKTNGSNKSDIHECPDPACKSVVQHTAKGVEDIKTEFDRFKPIVFEKLGKIAEDVAYMRGEMKGGGRSQ